MMKNEREQALLAASRAQKKGASACRINVTRQSSLDVVFEKGRLKNTGSESLLSFAVEVIKGGRFGRASGSLPAKQLEAVLQKALDLSDVGAQAFFSEFPPLTIPLAGVRTWSASTESLSREEIAAACTVYVDKLKQYDPQLFIMAGGSRNGYQNLTVTSGGVCQEENHSVWDLGGYVQSTHESDIFFSGYHRSWKDKNSYFDPGFFAAQTIEDLSHAAVIASCSSGSIQALLTPQILKQLLYAFVLGINGRTVYKRQSPLGEGLGKAIFHENLTLTDNPHLDYARGSTKLSDEGLATAQTVLVERGILKNFLYDLDSAGLAHTVATAHNDCRPYNLCVTPGSEPVAQIFAKIKKGLFIKELLGFGQGNLVNGDFSCNVSLGFLIENGEITGRLKNTMISGNIYELLRRPLTLSSDGEPTLSAPFALVEDLAVSC